jgi:hypothetical protein
MQRLYSIIVLIFISIASDVFSANEDVNRFSHCGEYRAFGKLKQSVTGDYFLILYGGSLSESSLKVISSDKKTNFLKVKLHSYLDSRVEILGAIQKKLRLREGEIEFHNIQELMSNPIDQHHENELILLKETPCK